jgi:hypothetical protein
MLPSLRKALDVFVSSNQYNKAIFHLKIYHKAQLFSYFGWKQ